MDGYSRMVILTGSNGHLFLHPNFPAQFKNLCSAFAGGHRTRFLCQTHYGRSIKGVERIKLKIVM